MRAPSEHRDLPFPLVPLAIFLLLLVILLAPRSIGAQEVCEAPARCASPADTNAAADVLCRQARAAELRLPQYREAAAKAERRENRCIGELDQTRELAQQLLVRVAQQPTWSPPLWLVIPLRVVAVGATSVAAYSLARGLPPELAVGFAVGGIGALLVDVVLEVVRR